MNPSPLLEHTIYREPIVAGTSPDIERVAVRGIVTRGTHILMVYSPVNGDFKFPGGGVEAGETHAQALVREVEEETGITVRNPYRCVARIREYGPAAEPDAQVFMMDSFYYLTDPASNSQGEQSLDAYEHRLRFTPQWTTIAEAVENNELLMTSSRSAPRWTPRETWFLRSLLETPSLLSKKAPIDES